MKKTIEIKDSRLMVKDPCQDEKCAIVVDNCETGTWQVCYLPGYNGRPDMMVLTHGDCKPKIALRHMWKGKLRCCGCTPVDSGTVAIYEENPVDFPETFPDEEYIGENWYALETLDGNGNALVNAGYSEKTGKVIEIVVDLP